MTRLSRRDALKAALLGAVSLKTAGKASAQDAGADPGAKHAVGIEGQRRADSGDGTYLNPIVPGDHPDPTVLKDGADYYMTFSSFYSYPGVVIWHSRDLVNWVPIGPALTKPIGSVWAMDLVKHNGRFFIYIPATPGDKQSIFVIHADSIRGPWSDPIDLNVSGCIDPGHAVGEDGKRYLFFSGVRRIALNDDGLSTVGPLEQAYNPWRYPDDWVVEMFAPEGPKILRRNDWFYLIAAVGGTSGPPTSHMVTAARSRSIHGPWEDCPHNPIVHTKSSDEPWWSRGHATVVEGPADDWWMVYHGYENGFRTLGRQPLLEPIEWTSDGWFRAAGGTLSKPLPKPAAGTTASGFALSDDFSSDRFGVQWSFFNPGPGEAKRARYGDQALTVTGKGTTLADCSPLTFLVGDRSYEADITLDIGAGAQGGISLFYSERMFCGIGFSNSQMFTYNYGQEHSWMRQASATETVRLRVTNHENIVTFYYSKDGGVNWVKHPWQMEVSGYHHNVLGGFLSLKLGVFCIGNGKVKLRNFIYKGV